MCFFHLVFDNFIKWTDNFIGSNVFHTYGSYTVSYYGSICWSNRVTYTDSVTIQGPMTWFKYCLSVCLAVEVRTESNGGTELRPTQSFWHGWKTVQLQMVRLPLYTWLLLPHITMETETPATGYHHRNMVTDGSSCHDFVTFWFDEMHALKFRVHGEFTNS